MDTPRTSLPFEDLKRWTEESEARLKDNLKAGYEGKEKAFGHIAELRKKLTEIFRYSQKYSIVSTQELKGICDQVRDAINKTIGDLQQDTEIRPVLSEYLAASLSKEHEKAQQKIKEQYKFDGPEKNLFRAGAKSPDALKKVKSQAELVMSTSYLKIFEKSGLLDKHGLRVETNRNFLNRFLRLTGYFLRVIGTVNEIIEDIWNEDKFLSFQQLKECVVNYLKRVEKSIDKNFIGRIAEMAHKWVAVFIADFEALNEEGFLKFGLPHRFTKLPGLDSFIQKVGEEKMELDVSSFRKRTEPESTGGQDTKTDETKPVESPVPGVPAQIEPVPPAADVQPVAEAEKNAVTVQKQDTKQNVGSSPEDERDIDARVQKVLEWLDTLPVAQRYSYVRKEMGAMVHILQNRSAYPEVLFLFALYRLESFALTTETVVRGTAIQTHHDRDTQIRIFCSIFKVLESQPAVVDSEAQMFNARIVEFDKRLKSLLGQIKGLEETLDARKQHLTDAKSEKDHAVMETDREIAFIENEIHATTVELSELLERQDFDKMAEKNAKIGTLKTRKQELEQVWHNLQGDIQDLEANNPDTDQMEKNLRQLKAELARIFLQKQAFETEAMQILAIFEDKETSITL